MLQSDPNVYLQQNALANYLLYTINDRCDNKHNDDFSIYDLADEMKVSRHKVKQVLRQMCKLKILKHLGGMFDQRTYHINHRYLNKEIETEKQEIPDYSILARLYHL